MKELREYLKKFGEAMGDAAVNILLGLAFLGLGYVVLALLG